MGLWLCTGSKSYFAWKPISDGSETQEEECECELVALRKAKRFQQRWNWTNRNERIWSNFTSTRNSARSIWTTSLPAGRLYDLRRRWQTLQPLGIANQCQSVAKDHLRNLHHLSEGRLAPRWTWWIEIAIVAFSHWTNGSMWNRCFWYSDEIVLRLTSTAASRRPGKRINCLLFLPF